MSKTKRLINLIINGLINPTNKHIWYQVTNDYCDKDVICVEQILIMYFMTLYCKSTAGLLGYNRGL